MLRNAAISQMMARSWLKIVHTFVLRNLSNADIEQCKFNGVDGSQSKKERERERGSEGTTWSDNERDEEKGMCRTKRNKVNSEAHLAVLPSNLGNVPVQCKKLGRLACTAPCYRPLKLDRRRGKKSAANIWSTYLDRKGERRVKYCQVWFPMTLLQLSRIITKSVSLKFRKILVNM